MGGCQAPRIQGLLPRAGPCIQGGRAFLFLETDDFWRDFRDMRSAGIHFVREPRDAPYGTVAVFEDLYGNLWDLLQPRTPGQPEQPPPA